MMSYKTLILIVLLFVLGTPKVFAVTYATWDAANKASNITLSNGDLTATVGGGGFGNARSTISKSSGKWYWEFTVGNSGNTVINGVINSSAPLTGSFPGDDTNGWGYYSNTGNKYHGAGGLAYGASYTAGNVIGVALDMDAGSITFYKNNVSQGTAFTGLTGALFAAGAPNANGEFVTANFGASPFTYTPPTGFCYGLSDTCVLPASPSTVSIIGLVRALWIY